MAEESNRKFEVPWGTLLPVIAALAGILVQFKPLVSTRPPVPVEKPIEVLAEQDVDARLWQDPLEVAEKDKAALDAELVISHRSDERARRHKIENLAGLVEKTAGLAQGKVLLLAVMLNAGPYLEQGEMRLRTRQAVMEGLSESGFVPLDGEHIGFVTTPWPPETAGSEFPPVLLIPWEECRRAEPLREGNKDVIERIFVLWLPATNFNSNPLGSFAQLLDNFSATSRDKLGVKLIGPANSTGLEAMVKEVSEWKNAPALQRDLLLQGVEIISPRATASDDALLGPLAVGSARTIPELLDNALPGLCFIRTVAPDDLVLCHLVGELACREVHAGPWRNSQGKLVAGDRVVILTEWDNPYGRYLASTFDMEARSFTGEWHGPEEKGPQPRVMTYRYLHGIDGRLPGDANEKVRSGSTKENPASADVTAEATEGLDQSDFLRRLAAQLSKKDTYWQREDGSGVKAIGLLGADVFDKLMILRALRPEFPNAIFFTDNYDAHLARRDALEDTHNLVIVSPYGSTLPVDWQAHLAPFRDSYQTSTYVATLRAAGAINDDQLEKLIGRPHIFEISRRGAYELSAASAPEAAASPEDGEDGYWFRHWLGSDLVERRLTIGAIALFAMFFWVSVSIVDRKVSGGGSVARRLQKLFSNTAFWLSWGVPLIVLLVSCYAQQGAAIQEPLAFVSGISIWPSEMLRLIALFLAVHFMIKASLGLRANEREINKDFFLDELPRGGSRWQRFRLGLRRWQAAHGAWLEPGAKFSAVDAWHAYLLRNRFAPRLVRVATLFLIYVTFAFSVLTLFGQVAPPARGKPAFDTDTWVLRFSVVGLLVLTFYVVDAIQLNSNFIRIFTHGIAEWKAALASRTGRVPPLSEGELSPYHGILFVADRTEVVSRLIWYPLIVLTLMFIARSAYFDNWAWPASLILIFTLNAGWAIGSAIFLRRAAEQLRETAIRSLQKERALNFARPEKSTTLDELIGEIRGLKKGAFAPLSEQPFIRAVLVPSGSVGLLAVAQRLFDLF